jgi:hypothetical protein
MPVQEEAHGRRLCGGAVQADTHQTVAFLYVRLYREVSYSIVGSGVEHHGALDAAEREEVEGGLRVVLVRHISWVRRDVARRHAVGGELSVDAHHQHVALGAYVRRGVELEGKVSSLVSPQPDAVEPRLRQIVDGAESQPYPPLLPPPRQIESDLAPGRPQVVSPTLKLVIPASGNGDGPMLG